jgi:hypothetical protein
VLKGASGLITLLTGLAMRAFGIGQRFFLPAEPFKVVVSLANEPTLWAIS